MVGLVYTRARSPITYACILRLLTIAKTVEIGTRPTAMDLGSRRRFLRTFHSRTRNPFTPTNRPPKTNILLIWISYLHRTRSTSGSCSTKSACWGSLLLYQKSSLITSWEDPQKASKLDFWTGFMGGLSTASLSPTLKSKTVRCVKPEQTSCGART